MSSPISSAEIAAMYVAPPSIGHEIGVMFGFIGAMVLSMAVYGTVWQRGNKRSQRKEQERVDALRQRGMLAEGYEVKAEGYGSSRQ